MPTPEGFQRTPPFPFLVGWSTLPQSQKRGRDDPSAGMGSFHRAALTNRGPLPRRGHHEHCPQRVPIEVRVEATGSTMRDARRARFEVLCPVAKLNALLLKIRNVEHTSYLCAVKISVGPLHYTKMRPRRHTPAQRRRPWVAVCGGRACAVQPREEPAAVAAARRAVGLGALRELPVRVPPPRAPVAPLLLRCGCVAAPHTSLRVD